MQQLIILIIRIQINGKPIIRNPQVLLSGLNLTLLLSLILQLILQQLHLPPLINIHQILLLNQIQTNIHFLPIVRLIEILHG